MTWAAVLLLMFPPDVFGLPSQSERYKVYMETAYQENWSFQIARRWQTLNTIEEWKGWRRCREFWEAAYVLGGSPNICTLDRRWQVWNLLRERLW